MNEDELVVLEFFSDQSEASVVKGLLEANGIAAYIFNNDPAHRFTLGLGATNTDFAFRLLVKTSDLEEARKLLREQAKAQA